MSAFAVNARSAAMEFDSADLDRDRELDFFEFSKLVREREMAIHTEEELHMRFDEMDADGSGSISVPEFIKFALRDALSRAAGQVADLLSMWDTDGDNMIDVDEFRKAVLALGFEAQDEEVDAIFEELDGNHSGTLELRELKQKLFERGPATIPGRKPAPPAKVHDLRPMEWQEGLNAAKKVQEDLNKAERAKDAAGISKQLRVALARSSARLLDLFRAWDDNHDGLISKKEFRQAVVALGYDVPKVEVDALFDSFDKDGNGTIDYRELGRALRRNQRASTERTVSELTPTALLTLQQQEEAQGGIANSVRNAQANVLRGTVLSSDGDLVSQLSSALASNWGRVTDLFHEMDTDRSGTVSRAEMRAALAHLGLGGSSAHMQAVDVLYDTLDVDGDGEISIKELTAVVRPSNALQDTMPGNPRQRTIVAPPKYEPVRLMTPHTRERVAAQEARERARLAAQNQLRDGSAESGGMGMAGVGRPPKPPGTATSDGSDLWGANGSPRFERPVSTPRQGFRPGSRPTKLTDAEWFEANKANAPKPSPRAIKQAAGGGRYRPVPPARGGRAGVSGRSPLAGRSAAAPAPAPQVGAEVLILSHDDESETRPSSTATATSAGGRERVPAPQAGAPQGGGGGSREAGGVPILERTGFNPHMRHNAAEYQDVEAEAEHEEGFLSFDEFCAMWAERHEEEFTTEQLQRRFMELDTDGNGRVDRHEFIRFSLVDALSRTRTRVLDMLSDWDTDGSKTVDKREFRRAVQSLGFDFCTRSDIDQVFDALDEDGSGEISFRELNSQLRPSTVARNKYALRREAGGRKGGRMGKAKLEATHEKSVVDQLRDVLVANRVRVIDLFREWDADMNGLVDQLEFRDAVRALGYDAPREHVDALFAQFDRDGSGTLEFSEINKLLRQGGRRQGGGAAGGKQSQGGGGGGGGAGGGGGGEGEGRGRGRRRAHAVAVARGVGCRAACGVGYGGLPARVVAATRIGHAAAHAERP